jgi:hypothetical protein
MYDYLKKTFKITYQITFSKILKYIEEIKKKENDIISKIDNESDKWEIIQKKINEGKFKDLYKFICSEFNLEIYDRNINKQIPKPSSDSGNAPTGAGFDLEHAKSVSAQIHAKEHKNLDWHGKIIDRNGGMIGAYVEAINILNGTDYTLKEIYDKITSAHPEQKHKNHPVYENEDINDYYNISVSREDPTIENIKKALSEGKLVAEIVNTTKWRDEHGKLYGKTGRHTGLIFYYDGTYFHMKTSVKKDAIYTEAQLREWLGHTKTKLIVYSRK